jgi:nucleotide-binding universal stress UspA family protein
MTTLQKHPPAELAFRPSVEEQNVPSAAIKDYSVHLRASSRGRINQETGRRIRRILVPTDFSPASASALERAVELARQTDASLTILHVIDINPPAASKHCGTAEDLMRQLWVSASSELTRLKNSFEQPQVRIQTLLVEGLPYEAIVENSSGFDLLIISEPHPKSVWNFFSKHTARRVIEQAKCPVDVVRQETGLASLDLCSKTSVAA